MTTRLAVFGNPVQHSRSPEIHQWFGETAGIDLVYDKILIPGGLFEETARAFLDAGGHGFNITVPGKGDAFNFVDEVSSEAALAEAVNTVSRQGDALRGDNTDGQGIVTDMTQNLGWKIAGARVLVLGAGGAVRGVIPALLRHQPQSVHILNRTKVKATAIAQSMADGKLSAVSADEIGAEYDIVINGTSAGLTSELPVLPEKVIGRHTCTYDMVYGGSDTTFNLWAKHLGTDACADGLGMLVEQAAAAFRIWFPEAGHIDTAPLIQHMRSTLV